jgi:2-polyprenyl-3-methyl-5-hydroxy-6-metoxy-1,4-benzoquinol methylase
MNAPDLVTLERRPGFLADLGGYLIERARGKRVLNVGAAGGVHLYLPDRREVWLHHRLGEVAQELTGIDVDAAAIAHAGRHGVELVTADCETMDLGGRFELIVMADVIEHLARPGQALEVLVRHLEPGGELILTTPNPTYAGTVARALLNRDLNVYREHLAGFLPEHLEAMCQQQGWRLGEVRFFTLPDRRSASHRLKSALGRGITWAFPRLGGWFVAVIEPGSP